MEPGNSISFLDSTLNWLVPAILVIGVIAFIYLKFVEPAFGKHIKKLTSAISGEGDPDDPSRKVVVYE